MTEPWKYDATTGHILAGNEHVMSLTHELATDGARLVACVNACAGIPTEQLEAGCVERLVKAASAAVQYIYLAHREEIDAGRRSSADIASRDFDNLQAALAPFQDKPE